MNGEYPNDPLHYPCRTCGAAPRKRCRTTSGTHRTTDTHYDRVQQRDAWIDAHPRPKILKTN